ncbi:hypothetical protein [Nostoc sp.]|uniref:hypothetical protein n=1 Tax=Nostoc sp. TaxID=1180 RepID=UPI002FF7D3C5
MQFIQDSNLDETSVLGNLTTHLDGQINGSARRGTEKAHWCQLNVKAALEAAFRDCLVPSL